MIGRVATTVMVQGPPRWRIPQHTTIRLASVVAFFSVWQIATTINKSTKTFNPAFFPSPTDVLQATADLQAQNLLVSSVLTSGVRLLGGFAVGAVLAVVVGMLVARSKLIESILDPLITMIGPIPPFAFLPILIIWMGISWPSKIALVAYATFLPILAYTVDGIKHVDPLLIRSARSLGANERQVFLRVLLPSALPNIFVGMRISLGLGFSALVVAEMVGASNGLGYLIMDARTFFKVGQMFSAAALIGLEYTIFSFILGRVEGRLFHWRHRGLEQATG